MENTFYFSISAQFLKDYDVKKFENVIGLKAKKLTFLKDSKDSTPSAKYYYCTEEYDEGFPSLVFSEYIQTFLPRARDIKKELVANYGNISFCIIFNNFTTKPFIYLSENVINILNLMGATFEVDYI